MGQYNRHASDDTLRSYTYVRTIVWLATSRVSFLIPYFLPLIEYRTYPFFTWFLGLGRIGEVSLAKTQNTTYYLF